jgi:membrane protease YdiL (CAAX protease family)
MAPLAPLRRAFYFPLVQALVAFFWIAIFMALAESLVRAFVPATSLLVSLALAPGALVGYYTFVRVIERRDVPELCSPRAPGELLLGLTLGAALMSLVVAVIYIAGAYSVNGFNNPEVAVPALVAAVMAGVTEELLIRAAVFRIIERWLGSWITLGLTAALFGGMHIPNPNATAFSTLSVSVGGGLMLCAAYMTTRRIWLPIGIHIAWNFFQGGVFGVATSGVATSGLLQSNLHGPTYLSGGAFGAEGSVVAFIAFALATLSLLLFANRRGQFVSGFRWSRHNPEGRLS